MSDPNVISQPVSSTPAPSDSGAAPATATPVANPTQAAVPATSTPAPAAPPTSSVPPGYVPSHRIREIREQESARYSQLEASTKSEIERLTKQVQALTGVTPQTQNESDVIRQQLFKVVPQLEALIKHQEKLERLIANQEQLEQQNNHYWTSYNRTQMGRLFKAAESAYGQPLTDAQKRYLAGSFVGWASGDPELEARYQSDPELVEEFWKEFSSNFVEPARRAATATTVQRAPANLPQDTPSGAAVRTTPAPSQAKDLDGRVDEAWQAFKQLRAKG